MSGHRWYYDNIFHFRQSIYIYGAIGEEVLQWKDRDPNQDWETNLYLEKLLQVWTQKLCNIFGPFWKVTHGHYHLFLCDRERESQRMLVLSLTPLCFSPVLFHCKLWPSWLLSKGIWPWCVKSGSVCRPAPRISVPWSSGFPAVLLNSRLLCRIMV